VKSGCYDGQNRKGREILSEFDGETKWKLTNRKSKDNVRENTVLRWILRRYFV
jgi:hypothetical protein